MTALSPVIFAGRRSISCPPMTAVTSPPWKSVVATLRSMPDQNAKAWRVEAASAASAEPAPRTRPSPPITRLTPIRMISTGQKSRSP